MAWVKIPPAHHPLFHAALPKDPRISTMQMFGGVAAKANGHMFGGLFGRSAIVRLNDQDKAEALALDGAGMFDPMGNGKVSQHSVQLPESVMDEPGELKGWLDRAFRHAMTLPAKSTAKAKAPPATKPTSKAKPMAKPKQISKPAPEPAPAKAPTKAKPAKAPTKAKLAEKLPPAARTTNKRPPRPAR